MVRQASSEAVEGKIRCDACPVMCYIAEGKSGAPVFIARDKAHLGAMTGSYFRGDAEADSKIQDGSISRNRYDPFSATVRKIEVSQ